MDSAYLIAVIGLVGTLLAGCVGFLGALIGARIGREATFKAIELQAQQNIALAVERTRREDEREAERHRREEAQDVARLKREADEQERREQAARELASKQKWLEVFRIVKYVHFLVQKAVIDKIHLTLQDAKMVAEYEYLKVELSKSITELEMSLVAVESIAVEDKRSIMEAVLFRHNRRDSIPRLYDIEKVLQAVIVPKVDPDMFSIMTQWSDREF